MNAECKLKGYKLVSHELMLSDVCQKVIVPVLYSRGSKDYYKLKPADVKDVLKYRALTQLQQANFIQDAYSNFYFRIGTATLGVYNSNFMSSRREIATAAACMHVCIVVKQESFPLHYANAQLQLDGGSYHCELIFAVDSVRL